MTALVRQGQLFRGQFTAMASPCEMLIETNDKALATRALEVATEEALRIEYRFSRYRDDNLIHKINHAGGDAVDVDDELARLLDFADQVHGLSGGLFDITSGVLRRLWQFDGSDRVPSRKAVKSLLPLVGWQRVDWKRPLLRMPVGMEIDLGGIGKEYAVDRALDRVAEFVPDTVPILLNFGGDLRANRAPSDRSGWTVGVESIQLRDMVDETVTLSQGALTTSGDARRYLLRNGVRYSHVLNPRTGWPVMRAPRSVTVHGATCVETGILSTLAMLKGSQAEQFLQAQGARFWVQWHS